VIGLGGLLAISIGQILQLLILTIQSPLDSRIHNIRSPLDIRFLLPEFQAIQFLLAVLEDIRSPLGAVIPDQTFLLVVLAPSIPEAVALLAVEPQAMDLVVLAVVPTILGPVVALPNRGLEPVRALALGQVRALALALRDTAILVERVYPELVQLLGLAMIQLLLVQMELRHRAIIQAVNQIRQ
jgi:hypothetical protein